mgnify:CR=1 FL=1
MILGRVSGTVVSTIRHGGMENKRLLVIDRLAPDGEPTGGYLIAVDAAQAGVGETVLVLDEGNGARQVLGQDGLPIRSVVVGIVDDVMVAG